MYSRLYIDEDDLGAVLNRFLLAGAGNVLLGEPDRYLVEAFADCMVGHLKAHGHESDVPVHQIQLAFTEDSLNGFAENHRLRVEAKIEAEGDETEGTDA